MTPAVVVDVGNSRIKWGLCSGHALRDACSLPPDDPGAWLRQLERWSVPAGSLWVVTGVAPVHREQFAAWLRGQGHEVRLLDDPRELPLRVLLERPDHVGIDRLCDAVAANSRRPPHAPAVVIDAGSAVTVDLLDTAGAFTGGAIFPGLRLMAKALHDCTALLPLIDPPEAPPALPGTATRPAMAAGIFWSVVGGIEALVGRYAAGAAVPPAVYLTGGDAARLHAALPHFQLWPTMTLEGIRLAAEALP